MSKIEAVLKVIDWAVPYALAAAVVWMMLAAQYDRGFRRGATLTANLAGCVRDDTGSRECRKLLAALKAKQK